MVDQCTDMVEQCVSLQQLQNKLEERMDKLDMPDHDTEMDKLLFCTMFISS